MKRYISIILAILILCGAFTGLAELLLWSCEQCGMMNVGVYCTNCGSARTAEVWVCGSCGMANLGRYCGTCGAEAGSGESAVSTRASTGSAVKLKAGEIVSFGHYEQDNSIANGMEPIEWIVVSANNTDREVTLLSRYVLDSKAYNNVRELTNWEDCSLRTWLNDSFLNAAFSPAEQEMILASTVSTNGHDTVDKVFLLDYSAAHDQIATNADRSGQMTAFARSKNTNTTGDNAAPWWLRSTGKNSDTIHIVTGDGTLGYMAICSLSSFGVRPVIRVSIPEGGFDEAEDSIHGSMPYDDTPVGISYAMQFITANESSTIVPQGKNLDSSAVGAFVYVEMMNHDERSVSIEACRVYSDYGEYETGAFTMTGADLAWILCPIESVLGDHAHTAGEYKITMESGGSEVCTDTLTITGANAYSAYDHTVDRTALNVGDRIFFGSYPRTEDGETEDVAWQILDIQGDKALLISVEGVDAVKFNNKSTGVSWKNSSIRTWMNDKLFNGMFDKEERKAIVRSAVPIGSSEDPVLTVPVEEESESETEETEKVSVETVTDLLFLLSNDEYEAYFGSLAAAKSTPTAYASQNTLKAWQEIRRGRAKGTYMEPAKWAVVYGAGNMSASVLGDNDSWWLRDTDPDAASASYVESEIWSNKGEHIEGKIGSANVTTFNIFVRPAMWIDLSLLPGQQPRESLQVGSLGKEVESLQQALIDKGVLEGPADGNFGEMTESAIKTLQEKYGMEPTGIADEEFQRRLYGE